MECKGVCRASRQTVSKMSQGLVNNARELGFPGGDSGAQYFDTSEEKMRNIKRQLDSEMTEKS
ncbi:unnamed protein product [Rhizopus stolonifer]